MEAWMSVDQEDHASRNQFASPGRLPPEHRPTLVGGWPLTVPTHHRYTLRLHTAFRHCLRSCSTWSNWLASLRIPAGLWLPRIFPPETTCAFPVARPWSETRPASFRWPFPVCQSCDSFVSRRFFLSKVWRPDSLLKNQAEPPLNFQLSSGNLRFVGPNYF